MPPRDRSDAPQPNPDRLEVFTGLLGDFSRLITEIEANQESQRSDDVFSFDHLAEFQVEIPESISTILPDVNQVIVTLNKDSDVDHVEPSLVSISVDFVSPTAIITVNRTGQETDNPDVLLDTSHKMREFGPHQIDAARRQLHSEDAVSFNERLWEVGRVSREDFNKLIFSLIYPDKERGYSMFGDADLFTPRVYESLRDSFFMTALNHRDARTYSFESNDVKFTFFKEDGDPTSFTITYPDEHTFQPIKAMNNLETDFELKFTTVDDVGSNPFDGKPLPTVVPYYPTSEEISYLRSIIETEIFAISPTDAIIGDDDIITTDDPESLFLDTRSMPVISKRHVADVLNKLGFDSPDSGAA